ncbi:cystatin-C-like [Sorex fumeus]|uniref:cystatin-C-like n=1 Tax=Sorex fumeus TaxID=62283 RepID=UPI0024AD56B1|nr:cystatin-C-like [Sorex fumeus]
MASSLRSLLLLAALALAMSSVVCARSGLKEYGHPLPKPAQTPKIDPNEELLVQRLLNFTMLKYNVMSNETHLRRPVRLLSTRKENVAATNYYLEVEIGKTTCTRDEVKKYGWFTCPFDEKKERMKCLQGVASAMLSDQGHL